MEPRISTCHADYKIHLFPIRAIHKLGQILNLWLYHTAMLSSLHTLKVLNSFLTRKNFPGKWRIENFLVALIKVSPDFYLHRFGFWWRIEDNSTKRTFLANCENSTSELFRKLFGFQQIVFVDIGSNLGWYSLLAASLNSNSKVFAFEPVNEVREKLHQNLQRNGYQDIHVESCALGTSPHTAKIWSYSDNNGMHTLHPVEEWGAKPGQEVRIEVLDRYTELFCELNLPILVKLDVEGSEMDVLRGGISLLKVDSVQMIIEVNEAMLLAGGTSSEELFTFLKSFGFCGYWISPDATLMAQSAENPLPHRGKLPDLEGANYFFTKNIEAAVQKINVR
jgi:FkbM family methyltransferase